MIEERKKYMEWMENPYFDEKTKSELRSIQNNEAEIQDRFYCELEFGTAGLRGVVGAGTNRMNLYTVRKATQGLANYIKKIGKQDKAVAIAYDSRNYSIEFAEAAALCLAGNGICAYIFESLRPTPVLSYAVRKLSCIAGINITASHNPPEYNGYKVYWEDGAQVTPPHDIGIMQEVKKIQNYEETHFLEKEEAIERNLYRIISKDLDDAYIEELKKHVMHFDSIQEAGKDLKIVYTPLHGTGNIPVQRILNELGFSNVFVVQEQAKPDGNFPTVDYPNPEAKEAFALALKLAQEKDADLVLATDPDADRLGVYVKDKKSGSYICLTGNMSGCLLAEYEIGQKREKEGKLPKDGVLIKTIVTSNLAKQIANFYDISLIEVLTGFKYIGQKIKQFEEQKSGTYLFGFEESYGCLIGTYARDKDAVSATMALCEAAAYYATKGMTLWDAMLAIYEKYGYYQETVHSITLKGKEGIKQIQEILERLRIEEPSYIGKQKVKVIRDYQKQIQKNIETKEELAIELPVSDVLYYELEGNAWVCIRPSGTEPKIKIYYEVIGESLEDAEKKSKEMKKAIEEMIPIS